MDLNTAANILIKQKSDIVFDEGDVLIHQLEDGRLLIQQNEKCRVVKIELSQSHTHKQL
ncbi:hypothetical protein [Vibrio parahaemolyticus]|uniref:hypothetical protein n=1 Tax=Vibrio parahaemolyticus TaxID=670 RepID=UPI003299A915